MRQQVGRNARRSRGKQKYLKLAYARSAELKPNTGVSEALSDVPVPKEVEGGIPLKPFVRAGC